MSSLEENNNKQVATIPPARVLGDDPEAPPKQSLANNSPAKSGFFMPGGALKELDKDGDGFISRQEVEEFIGEHKIMNAERKLFKKAFIALLITLMFFSAAIVLVVYGIILETKDTEMNGDVMVSKDSGDAIQCANTDLIVVDGTLVSRDDAEKERRLQPAEGDDFTLSGSTATAIGVRNVYKRKQFSSTLPDSYFKELIWFDIESPLGAFLSFKMLTTVRIPSAAAACGTYLKIGTLFGTLILDDRDIYFDDPMGDTLAAAGLFSFHSLASINSTHRKLSSINHPDMRRLSGDEFSVIGFFNAIDDFEWTCTYVRKPSMPKIYSAEFSILTACELGGDYPNQCLFSASEIPHPIPGYALETVEGVEYSRYHRSAYVDAEKTYLVDTHPHMPGMKVITEVFPDKTARKYQIDDNGVASHCGEFTEMDIRMTLPDDYILYPLGAVDGGLYRYRVSYKGIKGTVTEAEEWIHIDYFEDEETRLPKSLISDNDILHVESMLVGDEMNSFTSTGLLIDADSFKSCLIHTNAAYSNNYEKYVNGDIDFFTGPNTTATVSEIERYQEEWSSWNWTYVPYPPRDSNYASMKMYDVDYYSRTYVNATFDPATSAATYVGLNAFGDWLASILTSREELYHLSEQTNTTSRHLLSTNVKTNPLNADINLDFMSFKLVEGTSSTFKARGATTLKCIDDVICATGSITIDVNSVGKITLANGWCMDVTMYIRKLNKVSNVGQLCYEVKQQAFDSGSYTYSPLTHFLTLSTSYIAFETAEVTFKLKFIHTNKRSTTVTPPKGTPPKGTPPKTDPPPSVVYQYGSISLDAEIRIYSSTGSMGVSSWRTVWGWHPIFVPWGYK